MGSRPTMTVPYQLKGIWEDTDTMEPVAAEVVVAEEIEEERPRKPGEYFQTDTVKK